VHKNSYVFMFAASVTIVCSLLLASAANLLKDRQQENIKLDMQINRVRRRRVKQSNSSILKKILIFCRCIIPRRMGS
jgi:Na+-transporting NADH:ubiquinone oxidoreductase subunit NqrC